MRNIFIPLALLCSLALAGGQTNGYQDTNAFTGSAVPIGRLVLTGTAYGTNGNSERHSFMALKYVEAQRFIGDGFYVTNVNAGKITNSVLYPAFFTNVFPVLTNGVMFYVNNGGYKQLPTASNSAQYIGWNNSGYPIWKEVNINDVAGYSNFTFPTAPSTPGTNYVWGTTTLNLTGEWIPYVTNGGSFSVTGGTLTNQLLLVATVNENNDNWTVNTDVWNTASNEDISSQPDDLKWYPKTNGLFLVQWKSVDSDTNRVAYAYLTTNYNTLSTTNYYDVLSVHEPNMLRRWSPVYVDTNSAIWIRRQFSASPYVGASVRIWLIAK
jgi:hypothetical protein